MLTRYDSSISLTIVNADSDKPLYTIQIFWKGDPGVENFVIRFTTEDMMNKWRDQVTMQKRILCESARSSGQPGTSETEFTSMKNQASLENPYLQDDDLEEDDSQGSTLVDGQSNFAASRNASNSSLRAAATLASTSMLPLDRSTNRVPPPRFPQSDLTNNPYPAALTLHTNLPPNAASPVEFPGNSFFSPAEESPMSTRSISQASNYFLPPRNTTPGNGWPDDNKHKTAPAMSRVPSRDGTGPLNSYTINGRTVQRPSLPVMTASQNHQQIAMPQSRLRSVSTPDIHNSTGSGSRRYANGQLQASIDNIPVPPLPSHMAQMRGPVNRSQTSSPINAQIPIRSATKSPQLPHHRQQHHADVNSRANQQVPLPLQIIRPPQAAAKPVQETGIPYPSQLKVKIWFEPAPSHVTIVVPIIIKHRSLIDRIDSKMVKISSASISSGTARLRYKDQDGDTVTIVSDEDVSLAIEDWGLGHLQQLQEGIVGDFELYWHEL